ncbi:MAG: SDR family oxidoreductase [Patescibacteria group bacterium]
MNVLIVGGSSGLGLEIGTKLLEKGASIYTTGRSPKLVSQGLVFLEFNITEDLSHLRSDLDKMLATLPVIDLLVYAAGFFENGQIAELSDNHIAQMVNVGITAPALILQRIIRKQGSLAGLIVITSTSQWIPRETEPVYSAVKAGLAMLAQSVSLDKRIKKTLVVGPAGMNTNFWSGTDRDTTPFMLPQEVAVQILELWQGQYTYRLARILRAPTPKPERVQILETR